VQVFDTLGKALQPVLDALLPIFDTVVTVIAGLAVTLLPLLQPVGLLIAAILTALTPLIEIIGKNLMTALAGLVDFLTPVIMALIPAVQQFGVFFGQLAPLFPQLYTALLPLLPPLAQLTVSLITLALQVITPFMPLIVQLAGLLTGVLAFRARRPSADRGHGHRLDQLPRHQRDAIGEGNRQLVQVAVRRAPRALDHPGHRPRRHRLVQPPLEAARRNRHRHARTGSPAASGS
jgi:hypothetical protein